MSRKFAVFDIDGTLIRWQLYHAIADALVQLGYISPAVYKAVKDARMLWKKRAHEESFKTYETQLVGAVDKIITDLTPAQFNEAVDGVFNEYKDQVYIYTRDLIKRLKKQSYLLFAISGSQIEIVGKIADYYGFDDYVGSRYEQKNGKFTGKKQLTIKVKHLILEEMVGHHGASLKGSIGVGDSEGDISLLEAVEKPIAFNPTAKLFKHAKSNGWPIVVERKNMVYKLNPSDGKYILA